MNIQRNSLKALNPAFSGHKKSLDKMGYEKHDFFYLYDPSKYKCEVELFNILKDANGNFSIAEKDAPALSIPMIDGGISADISELPEINSTEGFAYRFKLTDKKTGENSYAYDNGTVIGIFDTENTDNKYNVVLSNRAIINKNGPMQLIMPDLYYPGIENKDGKPKLNESLRAKALSSVRTHANKLGGNLFGIIARLPQLQKEGVKRIVGTPFTKDTISSHLYWTENAYQVAPTLGTEKDFCTLQEELFKNGINWIADAALVNEGFGGIHLSELLRKGPNSISKNMFRAEEKISLGILPDKCDYTRMKIINAPFSITSDGKYEKENTNYDPSMPTYIQFYDDRLASEEQKTSDSPSRMTTYDNKNTDNIYDITKHDDAVYPFPIEVNPSELERNIKNIVKEEGTVDLSNIETIKKIADFTYFNVVNKSAAAGLEVWDGNVDIAKLNFYRSDKDDARFLKLPAEKREEAIADFDRGALAVRDYAVNSGKYWTKLSADTQFKYASDLLAGKAETPEEYMSEIKKLVRNGQMPLSVLENVDTEVIENVLSDNYHLRRLDDADMRADINPEGIGNDYTVSDYILRQAMDVPLETLPFATNLLGIITSPYIAKKANVEDELGVSRYDLTKAGNPNLPEKYENVYSTVDQIYEKSIVPIISALLKDIPGISKDGMVTEYGKYVISEITPELTKYIITKAFAPNAKIEVSDDGKIDFSNVNSERITMQSLGIPFNAMTSEEEAATVVNLLQKGISDMEPSDFSSIKDKVKNRFKSRSLNDYKVAEMIIDRTESGLGWRIDAAKDIASIDSVRADADNMTDAWKNVIDFWKLYNQSVLEINPHAYTTAEITDLYDLFKDEDKTVFSSDADAERKFLQETGITSVANYNYFFSLLPDLFSNYSFENGNSSWMSKEGKNFELRNKMDTGWSGTNPGFLFQSPEDGVINSYTFFGNHDKPRASHCLALDLGLFNSDFAPDKTSLNMKDSKGEPKTHREIAAEVMQRNEADIDFDKVNPMAIAMGARLNEAFDKTLSDSVLKTEIRNAISDLSQGKFKGSTFDATAFGTRPFEVAISSVLDQVEYKTGSSIPNKEEIEAKVLESILIPAFDRYYSMYKLLVTLPGSPTDFAGDRVGASGYETKAKNYHQQNRNVIHWEWLNDSSDNKYKFVKEFYDKVNEFANLRSKKELSALNDGATVTLPVALSEKQKNGKTEVKTSEKIQAMLRYNDKGSVVLTLHDSSGANTPLGKKMNRSETKTDITSGSIYNRIVLDAENTNAKQGLKHGLEVGTKFKNERSTDNSTYKIAKMIKDGKDFYYLKREDSQGREIPITIKPEDYNTLILYKI